MPRDLDPSISERNFVLDALRQGLRVDGRAVDQTRDLEITFGDEYGNVDVRMGKTRVLARISAEIAQPYPNKPFEGFFTINTSLSPMSSPAHSHSSSAEETEFHISTLIEKSIRRSQALDTESLCIVAGKKCWHVRADVHFLDGDGGLLDAASIAVMAGLLHFRRPDLRIEGSEVYVYPLSERVGVSLVLLHTPICTTISYFPPTLETDPLLPVLDVTLQEERLRTSELTLTLNTQNELTMIHKAGGAVVPAHEVLRAARVASEKCRGFVELIKRRIVEDEEIRKQDGRGGYFEGEAAEDRKVRVP
ncbi:3'-5'-exoribonuclease [Saitoella coloradoensis]